MALIAIFVATILGLVLRPLPIGAAYTLMSSLGDSTLKLSCAMVLGDLIIALATPSNTARAGGVLFPVVRSLCSAFGSEPGQTVFQGNAVMSAMLMTSMLYCFITEYDHLGWRWFNWWKVLGSW